MKALWHVPASHFLTNIGPRDRADLLAVATRRNVCKAEYVFQAGSPGENVYILADGRAKIYQLSPLGKEMILWFCFSGEVFGLAEVSRGGPREIHAQACVDSLVYSIGRGQFKAFLSSHPGAALEVIDLLSCRLRVLGDMLLNLATEDVTSRVVKLILRLGARYGRLVDGEIRLDVPLTHQDMADMVGTCRQTVSTVIAKLRRDGLLHVQSHRICIRSAERLARLADGDQPAVRAGAAL